VDIAVIGAGNIGRTLGSAWLRAGHAVAFAVRDPAGDSANEARAQLGPDVRIGSIPEALGTAEVVVLALPGAAVDELPRENSGALQDKVIVDAANRSFGGPDPSNSVESIRANTQSRGIVRAFNSVGWENMADPNFDGIVADMLYCADPAVQPMAETLISALRMRPVLVGDLQQVYLVDVLTGLWAALAYGQKRGRNLAFKILER
jgi:predicted dinucleotide-binding enzyme